MGSFDIHGTISCRAQCNNFAHFCYQLQHVYFNEECLWKMCQLALGIQMTNFFHGFFKFDFGHIFRGSTAQNISAVWKRFIRQLECFVASICISLCKQMVALCGGVYYRQNTWKDDLMFPFDCQSATMSH